MPERFEICIVYKCRYINTLPFLSFPFFSSPVVSRGEYADGTSTRTDSTPDRYIMLSTLYTFSVIISSSCYKFETETLK